MKSAIQALLSGAPKKFLSSMKLVFTSLGARAARGLPPSAVTSTVLHCKGGREWWEAEEKARWQQENWWEFASKRIVWEASAEGKGERKKITQLMTVKGEDQVGKRKDWFEGLGVGGGGRYLVIHHFSESLGSAWFSEPPCGGAISNDTVDVESVRKHFCRTPACHRDAL